MDIRSDRQEGMSCVELGKKYHRWTHGRQSGTRSHRSSRSLAAPASAYTGKCRWPESPPCGGGPISGPLIPTTATPSHQTRFSAASRLTVRRPAVSARACPAGAIPMTMPWPKIFSVVSNVTWSISSNTSPAPRRGLIYLPISRHFTTLCVPILLSVGCLPHALKLLAIPPPLDYPIAHLYGFIPLFLAFYCPFFGKGSLSRGFYFVHSL